MPIINISSIVPILGPAISLSAISPSAFSRLFPSLEDHFVSPTDRKVTSGTFLHRVFSKVDPSPGNIFHCDCCSITFSKLSILKKHIIHDHCDDTFMCQFCNQFLYSLGSYMDHIIFIEGIPNIDDFRKYKCLFCKQRFYSIRSWQNHTLPCSTSNVRKCDLCKVTKNNLIELKTHILQEHLNLQFLWPYCFVCNTRIDATEDLTKHVLMYHSEKYDPTVALT